MRQVSKGGIFLQIQTQSRKRCLWEYSVSKEYLLLVCDRFALPLTPTLSHFRCVKHLLNYTTFEKRSRYKIRKLVSLQEKH
ncbi:hypothetical protein [Nostoc sp. MG11]|uniref:hypothetical protein n=1 Tax=Nostoc sp. MG11 TaxID=2721166 RepID=UPI001869261F|nr:hypothetical protein [Nostoc sp. MG11]